MGLGLAGHLRGHWVASNLSRRNSISVEIRHNQTLSLFPHLVNTSNNYFATFSKLATFTFTRPCPLTLTLSPPALT